MGEIKMKSKILNIVLIVLLSCVTINAQVGLNKLAQSTMNFLLVSVSPKASSMGDAFYAVGTGAESIFYNPAGIVETDKTFDATVNYTQWIAGINYLGGSIAYDLGNLGSVGLSMVTVDYGTIYSTSLITEAQLAQYPQGYIDNGELSNVGAFAFGLSYGRAINEQFKVGGSIRYVGQSLGVNRYSDGSGKDNDATKLVFDAGVKYSTGFNGFCFGMAIRNFSSQIKRESIDEQLPLTFTLGTAISLSDFFLEPGDENKITLAVDYLHSNNYSERINVGLEYRFMGIFALRGGYQTNRSLASFSGGVGINHSIGGYEVEINYSISQMDIFDNVNRLSINFAY
jgi:hypothetical protein